jgi:hypothetical protein
MTLPRKVEVEIAKANARPQPSARDAGRPRAHSKSGVQRLSLETDRIRLTSGTIAEMAHGWSGDESRFTPIVPHRANISPCESRSQQCIIRSW